MANGSSSSRKGRVASILPVRADRADPEGLKKLLLLLGSLAFLGFLGFLGFLKPPFPASVFTTASKNEDTNLSFRISRPLRSLASGLGVESWTWRFCRQIASSDIT